MSNRSLFFKILFSISIASGLHAIPAPGEWEVSAGPVYLKPSSDDSYFVIEAPSSFTRPTGTRLRNDSDYHLGYRIGLAYQFCGCDSSLRFEYTNLRDTHTRTVGGNFLWATGAGSADLLSGFENYAGSAASTVKYNWNRFDALYVQNFFNCCRFDLDWVGGLEIANLRHQSTSTFASADNTGTVFLNSKVIGAGPELGLSGSYTFYESCNPCCPSRFLLNLASSASLLLSTSSTRHFEVLNNAAFLNVNDQTTWRVIPALHAKVGLQYETRLFCLDTVFSLGYEFHSYIRGTGYTSYSDDVADALAVSGYNNFDVHGVYLTAGIRF